MEYVAEKLAHEQSVLLKFVSTYSHTESLLYLYIALQVLFSHLYSHLCYAHISSITLISIPRIPLQHPDTQ